MTESNANPNWDAAYRATDRLWGDLRPDPRLVEFADLVPPGTILDLGIGEGGNALWFAARGRAVEGIDISPTAIARVTESARKIGVAIEARVEDIRQTTIAPGRYGLIISEMVLQFVTPDECRAVVRAMTDGLVPAGLLSLSVFSTEDPMRARLQEAGVEKIADDAYFSTRLNSPVCFFSRSAVESLCTGLETISISQTYQLDLSHDAPHYHGVIAYVGRKR